MSDIATVEPELVEPDANVDLGPAEKSGRGTIITLATVIALLIATAFTVLGLGAADTAVGNFDAASWLWSSTRGEVDRVNGVTARVDTRARINDSRNHEIQVTQTDRYLVLRDLETGQVTALDLTTLQVSAVMPSTPGLGVSVALHGDTAFVIDAVLGQVRQLDPRTLAPTGDAIVLPKGVTPGGFDGKGTLWIAVPTEGTVVAIEPGKDGRSPRVLRTVTVASPGHDFELSTLDSGVAVLDNTEQKLSMVGDKVTTVAIPIDKPGIMAQHTVGATVAITVPDDRKVVLVNGAKVNQFTVAGAGPLGPAVFYADRVYASDIRTGVVQEVDLAGATLSQIKIVTSGSNVELEVRENYLFINAPDGSSARVVDPKHVVREVNKYQDGVLGGDPPPPPPPAPDPEPVVLAPGAPQNVDAAAGNRVATVAWRKANDNGAPVLRYVIEGFGQPIVVGASQRSVDILGLTNGQTYRFTVYAVNSVGAGPRASAPVVTPTADVPDPPTSVKAEEKPDGSVVVSWPAANGQGHAIASYRVTSITAGVQAPVGAVTDTTMILAKGSLKYGTQYAFTVVSINDKNTVSAASPVSNTVIPYTVPAAPTNLAAVADPNQRGAIQVTWKAAVSNGRPITKYVVETSAGSKDVTSTSVTLTGFPDDSVIPVKVHAVNLAGDGPAATTSGRTIGVPTVTITSTAPGYNTISVTFTPNNKGGNATCLLTVPGINAVSAACGNQPMTLTVGGLWPNNAYGFIVTIGSPAGGTNVSGSSPTNQLRATVVCSDSTYCGSGIYVYSVTSQANAANALGVLYGTNQFIPQCWTSGDPVNANPWGGKLATPIWLRLNFNGKTGYFPWAWAVLDGGDNYGLIPSC